MDQKPLLVGIAGGSGSGKTSILKAIVARLPEGSVTVLTQDNYYRPKEDQPLDKNGKYNFDTPDSIDIQQLMGDLNALMLGGTIEIEEYTFNNAASNSNRIKVSPAPIILTEGLFVLHNDELRENLDLKVFIEARDSVRLDRRIKRDHEERGYAEDVVMYQWENHVLPADKDYLYPYFDDCDLVIYNNESFDEGIEELISLVKRLRPEIL